MKKILLILTLAISFSSFSQTKELNYCHHKFQVPNECDAKSAYELSCTDFDIGWLYMNDEMLAFMPEQVINQFMGQVKKAKKESITCTSFDSELKGYLITYKKNKDELFRIMVYGKVNGQPVLVNLGLKSKPTRTSDLPDFLSKIIQLK